MRHFGLRHIFRSAVSVNSTIEILQKMKSPARIAAVLLCESFAWFVVRPEKSKARGHQNIGAVAARVYFSLWRLMHDDEGGSLDLASRPSTQTPDAN